jgi:hypothetical protein
LIYKYQINAPLIKKPIRNVTIKKPAKLLAMPVLQKTAANEAVDLY